MKKYFKLLLSAGLITAPFITSPAQGMEALVNALKEKMAHSVNLKVQSVCVVGDSRTVYPVFKEEKSWSQHYETRDGKALKVSFSYHPHEENSPSMPLLPLVEENEESVVHHFIKQYLRKIAPGTTTAVEETSTNMEEKLKFIKRFPATKEWTEALLKMPGFSPEELYQQSQAEYDQENGWKKKLYDLLNDKDMETFTQKYAIPANPGMLKKYHGVESGPILLHLPKESSTQQSKSRIKDDYTANLNYGVFTISLEKMPCENISSFLEMPLSLNKFMDQVDNWMLKMLDVQIGYAKTSYGNPRDNSHHMTM
jgi:hypothetical protein